jgi:hypothetical protein
MNEGAAIFFFATVVFVALFAMAAVLGRKQMKVGQLTTAIMQMQLHSQRQKEVDTHDGYDPDFFHVYEGKAVL